MKGVVVEEHYADSEHHRAAEVDDGKGCYTKFDLEKPREDGVEVVVAIL